jgi:hypothetical protein
MADAAATRFSGQRRIGRPGPLLPVHDHARHDHGGLSAYRAVPRRLRQLPHPADDRRTRHGVPLCEHAELLDLSAVGPGAGGKLLRARRSGRRRLDPLSAAGHPAGHAGTGMGHHPDDRLPGDLHRGLHHGRAELCDHRASGAHARDDDDAPALVGMGHLRGRDPGPAGLSRPVRRRRDDAAR